MTLLSGITSGVVTFLAYAVNYLISTIFGFFIMFLTWLTSILIDMSGTVANSIIVKSGFGVMLSVANLGFVTAIIFIAIATILRSQTYALKKTLWKLIVAALLINFSLVFAGAIINFSNQLTGQFMSAFPSTPGEIVGGQSFASRLTAAFQPQRYQHPEASPENVSKDAKTLSKTLSGATISGAAGAVVFGPIGAIVGTVMGAFGGSGSVGASFAAIISIIMVVLGNAMIMFVLIIFDFMLLVRYIYLSVLMILMPAAWLMWIFPGLSRHWTNWWSKFFQWTFFAPIVVFFMWLVITTGGAIEKKTPESPFSGTDVNVSLVSKSAIAEGIFEAGGDLATPIVETFLKNLLLVGLMVGGLIASQKLSITGAKAAVDFTERAGKGTGKWLGGRASGRLLRPPEPKIDKKTGVQKPLGPLDRMRQRIHDQAAAEKAKGEPGIASTLAGYGTASANRKKEANATIQRWKEGEGLGRVPGVSAAAKPIYYATAPVRGLFGFNKNSLMGNIISSGFKKNKLKISNKMTEEEVKANGWTIDFAKSIGIEVVKKKGGSAEEGVGETTEERNQRLNEELNERLGKSGTKT